MARSKSRIKNRRPRKHTHNWLWSYGPDGSKFRVCQTAWCQKIDAQNQANVTTTTVTPEEALAMIQGSKT